MSIVITLTIKKVGDQIVSRAETPFVNGKPIPDLVIGLLLKISGNQILNDISFEDKIEGVTWILSNEELLRCAEEIPSAEFGRGTAQPLEEVGVVADPVRSSPGLFQGQSQARKQDAELNEVQNLEEVNLENFPDPEVRVHLFLEPASKALFLHEEDSEKAIPINFRLLGTCTARVAFDFEKTITVVDEAFYKGSINFNQARELFDSFTRNR
jgi:hypothetical protein